MSDTIHAYIIQLIKSIGKLTRLQTTRRIERKSIDLVQARLQELGALLEGLHGNIEGKLLGEVHCLLQEIRQIVFPGEDRIGGKFYQIFKNVIIPKEQRVISSLIKENTDLIEKEILSHEKFRLVPSDIMKGEGSLAWSLVDDGKVEEAFNLLLTTDNSSKVKMDIVFAIIRGLNMKKPESVEFIKKGIKEMFSILSKAKSCDKGELTEFAKDIFEVALKKLSYAVQKDPKARDAILEIVDRAPFGWIGLLPED